jgi:diguanylate cyclase (GGDEF)-like protein/PAS domain S-box-containing protein
VTSPTGPPADESRSEDEQTLEELYEHAPCGYLTLDASGTIRRVNQTFLAWTGFERDALLGTARFTDLLTVGGRIYFETHCAPLLAVTGTVREIALDVRCADGHQLPVLFGAVAQPRDDGPPTVFRATVFDASHRRQYERQLLASREEERAERARAEALVRVSDRVSSLVGAPEIDSAIVGELIGSGAVRSAEIIRGSEYGPGTSPTFAEGPDGSVVGIIPLRGTAGGRLGTLRVEAAEVFDDRERQFLLDVADLAGRALERALRVAELNRVARGGDIVGLPNSRWWKAELDAEMRRAVRTRLPLTILLVELDHFDRYSEHHGHVAGDERLLSVSDAFRRAGIDLLSRYGGEEFVALMVAQTDRDAARVVAEVRREPAMRGAFVVGAASWDGVEDATVLVGRAESALADERKRRAAGA